jgi:hypothetical protein
MYRKALKLITGTSLFLSISLGAMYPAIADTPQLSREGTAIAQTMRGEPLRGTVQSIRNNIVTLELPNGDIELVEIPRIEQERLGLLPGKEILVYDDNTVVLYEPTTETDVAADTSVDEIRRIFEEIRARREINKPTWTPPEPISTPAEPQLIRSRPTAQPAPAPTPVRVETQPREPVRALW